MKVIPVIDLQHGLVVRGVAGQRERYRAVESVLGCDATPISVASAFVNLFDFSSVYVADLDAIGGAEPNWEAYRAIASTGLRLIVDAGTGCEQRANRFIERSAGSDWCEGVVIGLESLRGERDLARMRTALGGQRAVFSLDLKHGQPLTQIPTWQRADPLELVDAAAAAGFQKVIVLDLASVGLGQGVSVHQLCRTIRQRHPQLEITSGGGIRNVADLEELGSAGCNAVLVASALHDGRLAPHDLASAC